MLSNNIYQEQKIPTQWERAWQNFRSNSLAMFGLWCLFFLLIITFSAQFIAPYAPNQQVGELLMPPSWDPSGHVEFFFGTDDLGRDILTRLLLGSQLTMSSFSSVPTTLAVIS